MDFRVIFAQFVRDMRAQRQRTALTLFGLGWGTFCVIVLLSFGEGLHRRQAERMASLGDQMVLMWGSRTSLPYEGLPRGRYIRLEDADTDALAREVVGISAITPEYSTDSIVKGPKGEKSAGISGVRPCFASLRHMEPAPGGRFLNERDELERRRVAYLGAQIKTDLFGEDDPIGALIMIRGVPFRVIGINPKKDQDSNYNGQDDGKIFIPSRAAQASLGLVYPDNFVVGVRSGADSKAVIKDVIAVMGRRNHFDPKDEEALATWDVGDMVKTVGRVFVGFKTFLALLGMLTLAVAGIGVANIMSMAVEDRTTQIGISMALGARRGWVLGQILIETLLVTALGGALGVILAAVVVKIGQIAPLEESIGDTVLSWQIAALTVGLLGVIGIISGVGPARRAANLNPAVALRN
ncbi:MAG: ABC transporter permease [Candidatus Eisenbacteria bacterium]